MSGQDSSHDRSAAQLIMIALAAFSTSYNLPVYLRYNIAFRRTYIRMLRGDDSLPEVGELSRTVQVYVSVILVAEFSFLSDLRRRADSGWALPKISG